MIIASFLLKRNPNETMRLHCRFIYLLMGPIDKTWSFGEIPIRKLNIFRTTVQVSFPEFWLFFSRNTQCASIFITHFSKLCTHTYIYTVYNNKIYIIYSICMCIIKFTLCVCMFSIPPPSANYVGVCICSLVWLIKMS